MTDRNNGNNTEVRNPDGTFAAGNPGRPQGARHKVTRAVEELFQGEADGLTRKAISMALEGDTTAMRLCLERIAPARKDALVSFDLPEMTNASEAAQAAAGVLRAVTDGQITPLEGATVMALVENYRRVLETSDIEQRITALECSNEA